MLTFFITYMLVFFIISGKNKKAKSYCETVRRLDSDIKAKDYLVFLET